MKIQEVVNTAICDLYWALQLVQLGFRCYVPQSLLPSTMPLMLTHYGHGLAIMLKIHPICSRFSLY